MKEGISGTTLYIILLPVVSDGSCAPGSLSPILMVGLRPSHTLSSTTCYIQCRKQPRLRATENGLNTVEKQLEIFRPPAG